MYVHSSFYISASSHNSQTRGPIFRATSFRNAVLRMALFIRCLAAYLFIWRETTDDSSVADFKKIYRRQTINGAEGAVIGYIAQLECCLGDGLVRLF